MQLLPGRQLVDAGRQLGVHRPLLHAVLSGGCLHAGHVLLSSCQADMHADELAPGGQAGLLSHLHSFSNAQPMTALFAVLHSLSQPATCTASGAPSGALSASTGRSARSGSFWSCSCPRCCSCRPASSPPTGTLPATPSTAPAPPPLSGPPTRWDVLAQPATECRSVTGAWV